MLQMTDVANGVLVVSFTRAVDMCFIALMLPFVLLVSGYGVSVLRADPELHPLKDYSSWDAINRFVSGMALFDIMAIFLWF
jgi:hypothetical protein